MTLQDVTVTGTQVVTFATPPYLQNVRTNGIVVMCETAEDVPLHLEYGLDPSYGSSLSASRVASGGGTWFHRAILTGLNAGTHYHYRFTSDLGDPLTADGSFKTAPAGEVDFKFSYWSDSQGHNRGAYAGNRLEPTISMMQHMAAAKVDFGFSTGDLAENGNRYSDVRDYYLDRVARYLGPTAPWFAAWGNHDTSNPNSPLRLASDMPSRYRPGFSPGHGSFSFTYANCFFVCIDEFYNSEITNGWLEAQLASPEAQNARFRFLGVHVPPYCERWIDGRASYRSNLVPLLEKYRVNFCLSGHTHEYERGGKTGTDQHGDDHHVHYVINGNGSWLDHSEPIVQDWPHMTVGGAHDVPGTWIQDSGTNAVVGGLFNGYALISIRDDYLLLEEHGFHADGTPMGIMDSVEIGVDPGPDADMDGMRDPWETLHFGDPAIYGAFDDPDLDGFINLYEFLASTDPNNSGSVLKVFGEIASTDDEIQIKWQSEAGEVYDVLDAPSLIGPWSIMATNIPATPPINVVTVNVDGVESYFYQVTTE